MHIIDTLQDSIFFFLIKRSHNKIKYNGNKYLTSILFHDLEVFFNIECCWIDRRNFYKLLIPGICAYVFKNSLQVHRYQNLKNNLQFLN